MSKVKNIVLGLLFSIVICSPVYGISLSGNSLGERIANEQAVSGEKENITGLAELDGEGTLESPFLIKTPEDLLCMIDAYDDDWYTVEGDYYFALKNNIDLRGIEWNIPIGKSTSRTECFHGHFLGNGCTITMDTGELCVGIFGVNKGTIQDLTLKCVSGEAYLYPLCELNEGKVNNCNIILEDGARVPAALVQENKGTIEDCEVSGDGAYAYSGLVDTNNGTISECSVSGNIEVRCGFIDENDTDGVIENCLVNVQSGSLNGAVQGFASINRGLIDKCAVQGEFFNSIEEDYDEWVCLNGFVYANSGVISNSNCSALLKYDEVTEKTMYGFVEENKGEIVKCSFSGEMQNATTMAGFCGYNMTDDSESVAVIEGCYVKTDFNLMKDNNVGTQMYMDEGLRGFCQMNGGVINNSYVEGNLRSDYESISLCGFCGYNVSDIANSYFKGDISLNKVGGAHMGGFVNENSGDLTMCYVQGNISVKRGSRVGGLVGKNRGTILQCYTKGSLETASDLQNGDVGLLVGENNYGTIKQSMAIGNLKSINAVYTGGLLGTLNGGTVEDSFSNVEIIVVEDKSLVESPEYASLMRYGGLIGYVSSYYEDTLVKNCYSASDLMKDEYMRRPELIGDNSGDVKNSYVLKEHTYEDDAKNIHEFRDINTFKECGWDTVNIWKIDKNRNESFPYIKSLESAFDKTAYYGVNVTINGRGCVYPEEKFEVYENENYFIQVSPYMGSIVSKLTVNGVDKTKENIIRIIDVKGNVNIHATFVNDPKAIAKVGTKFKASEVAGDMPNLPGNATFTVTSSNVNNPTVSFDGTSDPNAHEVAFPGTITYKGIVYTVTTASPKAFTDSKSKLKFKVTNNKIKSLEVECKGIANKNKTSCSIPKTVTYKGIKYTVKKVADKAFRNNKKIKKITIDSNVTVIGNSAFYGCTKLTTVTFKGGSKLQTIGSKAFYNCKKLKTITIKSTKLKKIGKNAFKGIYAKCKIKVPSKKVKAYKKLFKGKGQKKTVKIVKG